jgi:hypothetical protein
MGVIVAASACGVWGLSTRAPVSHSVRATKPDAHIASAPIVAPVAAMNRVSRRESMRSIGAARRANSPATAERLVEAPSPPSATPRFGSAMRIPGDGAPEQTGPVLTVEEMQTLARLEAEGLVTLRNADGSETLNHEGRFADYTVIRIGPDGKPVFDCVQGEEAVKRALSGSAITPKTGGK